MTAVIVAESLILYHLSIEHFDRMYVPWIYQTNTCSNLISLCRTWIFAYPEYSVIYRSLLISLHHSGVICTPKNRVSALFVTMLCEGMTLTHEEFRHRYEKSDLLKFRLVNGIFMMPSTVYCEKRRATHAKLGGWSWSYEMNSHNVEFYDNTTVKLDSNNEYQADSFMQKKARRNRSAESVELRSTSFGKLK